MQPAQHTRHLLTKGAVALLLTFAAGCVDIVGFLTLYHTFTAHMTGATVHLGQDLLQEHWGDAANAGCVIATFLLGSILGRTFIEVGARRHVRSVASATLLLEAALIAAVAPLAADPSHPVPIVALLAMLAAAMGFANSNPNARGSADCSHHLCNRNAEQARSIAFACLVSGLRPASRAGNQRRSQAGLPAGRFDLWNLGVIHNRSRDWNLDDLKLGSSLAVAARVRRGDGHRGRSGSAALA